MKLKRGNALDSNADSMGITTNSILNWKGELVMGAGVALEAKKRFPDLPRIFGQFISKNKLEGGFYGIIESGRYFAFQTKRNWRDKSDITDVRNSVWKLKAIAERYPAYTYALPFPAINNGGLKREDILPLLEVLPDNVHVYEL